MIRIVTPETATEAATLAETGPGSGLLKRRLWMRTPVEGREAIIPLRVGDTGSLPFLASGEEPEAIELDDRTLSPAYRLKPSMTALPVGLGFLAFILAAAAAARRKGSPLAQLRDFDGSATDTERLRGYLADAEALRSVIAELRSCAADGAAMDTVFVSLLQKGSGDHPAAEAARRFLASRQAFDAALVAFSSSAGAEPEVGS
jgi:hypothetical protein